MPSLAAVTWLGHSTIVVELDGTRLITDPVLGGRVGPLRRLSARPAAPEQIDAVLISHAHYDHLDVPSLRSLLGRPRALVAPGSGAAVGRATRGPVEELWPGDAVSIGRIVVRAVPADHVGHRYGRSREGSAVGFVVEGTRRVYFAGDTDLFDDMARLGLLDCALLPVWGWGPSVGAGHLDPARAAAAVRLIKPSLVVPIHWGTLGVPYRRRPGVAGLRRPAEEFAALVRRDSPEVRVHVPAPGVPIALS